MTGIFKIPLYGVNRQYANLREEILDVTDNVYSSGNVLDGNYTKLFESKIAQKANRPYGVSVNSGTQALILALLSLDKLAYLIGRKKVLIPIVSFAATRNAVELAGYLPTACDVDPITGLINIDKINVDINEVAAVMYVNLLGNIIDYDKLLVYTNFFTERYIPIIEDAAQSFGAFYKGNPSGNLGIISCLSFDPTKNLNNYGSGGMLLTGHKSIDHTARNLKDNGKQSNFYLAGTNSKMSESDCAQMLVKLKHFDTWQQRRRDIAEYYNNNISNPKITKIPTNNDVIHAYSKFVIHCTAPLINRRYLIDYLGYHRIEAKPTYVRTLAQFDQTLSDSRSDAESFLSTSVSLPIYPELTDTEVEYIVSTVNNI